MTDILDTSEAPLSRTPARFFFETGYFAAYAEASIKAGNRPPFDLTDAIVDQAWEIAPEAHPDRAEFDRYLSSADSADAQLVEAEATYRAFDEANREADGSREGLAVAASSLRTYGADLFPANRSGKVHFARVLMDAAASVIEAALTAQPPSQGRPVSEACGIAMVEVLDTDRAELERGLFTQGFAPDRAHALAFSQPANDGALQMLARHRLAALASAPAGDGESFTGVEAWNELVNADDRTSPAEYPDMCLITRDELIDFMQRASAPAESEAVAFVRRVSEMVGDELDAHASTELRDAAREVIASAPAENGYVLMPRQATRAMIEAADACTDAYSAYNAMVEAAHVR